MHVYMCRVRNIHFEEQKNSFFLMGDKGFTVLKRHKTQFEILLEMYFVQAGNVLDKSVSMSIHGKRMV